MTSETLPPPARNVDPGEINKFERVAHRWWDKDSEFEPLHKINPLRLNYIDERSGGLRGKKVLDVGCGGGILSESMAHRHATVTGIDLGATPLPVANLHALESGIEIDYRQISAEELTVTMPEHFDVVTCMEMLEHVPDPASVINACATLVKPGGHVFFSTINRNTKAFILAIVAAEYVMNMLPKGTHEWDKLITPDELFELMTKAGLEPVDRKGYVFNFARFTWSISDRDLSVNYVTAALKPD